MGLRLLNQFKDILPIILLTATMGLLAYGSTFLFTNQVLKLLIGTFVGLVYFLTVSKIAKFEEFTFLLNLVKKQLKR